MPHELPIPPVARDAPSIELIRLWAADHKLHTVLRVGYWEERGIDECDAWGILLADMPHHVAGAHEETYGRDQRETIRRITRALERELARPTSPRLGEFLIERGDDV